jgi:hypothetical protein
VNKKYRKPVLNGKRRKLLKGIAKGLSQSEASDSAGYSHRQAGHRALQRMKAQGLSEMLVKAGCGVDRVLTKFAEKLEAKETKFFAHEGEVINEREVIAHDIQLRAAIQLGHIHRLYPQDTDEGSHLPGTTPILNINLGFLDPREGGCNSYRRPGTNWPRQSWTATNG